MFRKPALILLSALTVAASVLGTSTAAMADPPWARGGRGFHHGGPPAFAPAYGFRRHHAFGGYGRVDRRSRYQEDRRLGGGRGD